MQCDGKKAYMTVLAAQLAANGRHKRGVNYLRVYSCPLCGAYHLTSEEPKAMRVPEKAGGWNVVPDVPEWVKGKRRR